MLLASGPAVVPSSVTLVTLSKPGHPHEWKCGESNPSPEQHMISPLGQTEIRIRTDDIQPRLEAFYHELFARVMEDLHSPQSYDSSQALKPPTLQALLTDLNRRPEAFTKAVYRTELKGGPRESSEAQPRVQRQASNSWPDAQGHHRCHS